MIRKELLTIIAVYTVYDDDCACCFESTFDFALSYFFSAMLAVSNTKLLLYFENERLKLICSETAKSNDKAIDGMQNDIQVTITPTY